MFSGMMGGRAVHISRFEAGARGSPLAARWVVFDANVDAEVTVGGDDRPRGLRPRPRSGGIARGARCVAWPWLVAASLTILPGANTIVNVTVLAAVAAALGSWSPTRRPEVAERAAYVTAGIPGAKVGWRARRSGPAGHGAR
jgi:hypothetical protein